VIASIDNLQLAIGNVITVRSYKYDGSEHRHWPAQLVNQSGSLLVLDAKFEADVEHDLLGLIASGTHSLEYYWLDRWYNIFRFGNPDGSVRSFYCNVNQPPEFDGQVLKYTDLDLDILVNPDFSYHILDQEEFEKNCRIYSYPETVKLEAQNALCELQTMIETRAFPFNKT
jgi:protein associated with RNAse G/E